MVAAPVPGAAKDTTISSLVADLEVAEGEKQDLRQYNAEQTQPKVLALEKQDLRQYNAEQTQPKVLALEKQDLRQ